MVMGVAGAVGRLIEDKELKGEGRADRRSALDEAQRVLEQGYE